MSKWSDGYVNSNGLRIHYYRTGGNKPPVIINHGANDDGLCWTRIAKKLEKDYDVILPDARGHGKSGSGKGDYSTKARTADLAGLIQELNLIVRWWADIRWARIPPYTWQQISRRQPEPSSWKTPPLFHPESLCSAEKWLKERILAK